jgi:hypothetical protein
VHEDLRSRCPRDVLAVLGVAECRERKGRTEWFERCPIHGPKTNSSSFSFDETGKYHCLSYRLHEKGAIDLVMAIRKVGFQESVQWLEANLSTIISQQAAKPQIKQLQVPADPRPETNENLL